MIETECQEVLSKKILRQWLKKRELEQPGGGIGIGLLSCLLIECRYLTQNPTTQLQKKWSPGLIISSVV